MKIKLLLLLPFHLDIVQINLDELKSKMVGELLTILVMIAYDIEQYTIHNYSYF